MHNLLHRKSHEREQTDSGIDEVPQQIDAAFRRYLESLDSSPVEVAKVTIAGNLDDPDTSLKVADTLQGIPEGKACVLKVVSPFKTQDDRKKDIIVSSRRDIEGKVFTFFFVERRQDKITNALITQEISGFEFHQETTVKFAADDEEVGMISNPGPQDEAKSTTTPSECVEGITSMVAHVSSPVVKVIREVTEEFEKIQIPPSHQKSRVAAAAIAFAHPDRLAA